MRTFVVISVFAALSVAAAAAAAQQATQPSAAQRDQSMNTIEVNATNSHYKPTFTELDWIVGRYGLDNGDRLRVTRTHNKVLADVWQGEPVEMVPVGPYIFIAKDRSMMVEFNRGALGEDVLVTYHPDSIAAVQHGSGGVVAAR